MLVNETKTIQHHVERIYQVMADVFDFGDKIRDKRLALIKIMKGWE
jgi:hypothetical protein